MPTLCNYSSAIQWLTITTLSWKWTAYLVADEVVGTGNRAYGTNSSSNSHTNTQAVGPALFFQFNYLLLHSPACNTPAWRQIESPVTPCHDWLPQSLVPKHQVVTPRRHEWLPCMHGNLNTVYAPKWKKGIYLPMVSLCPENNLAQFLCMQYHTNAYTIACIGDLLVVCSIFVRKIGIHVWWTNFRSSDIKCTSLSTQKGFPKVTKPTYVTITSPIIPQWSAEWRGYGNFK